MTTDWSKGVFIKNICDSPCKRKLGTSKKSTLFDWKTLWGYLNKYMSTSNSFTITTKRHSSVTIMHIFHFKQEGHVFLVPGRYTKYHIPVKYVNTDGRFRVLYSDTLLSYKFVAFFHLFSYVSFYARNTKIRLYIGIISNITFDVKIKIHSKLIISWISTYPNRF